VEEKTLKYAYKIAAIALNREDILYADID